jgi:hypothetical protein
MAAADYNELITTTFRDNAIRSVMMIDDDFTPYDKLLDPNLSERKRNAYQRAANIHRFFQEKKIICDVDDNATHINLDKIRKCDLVILDYHLENEKPEISLDLIKKLSETEHMNLVVVYTSLGKLEEVWMQIAAYVFGSRENFGEFDDQPKLQEFWDENTESSGAIPDEWYAQISSEDIETYILNREVTAATKDWFGKKLKAHGRAIANDICERKIAELNKIKTPMSIERISGNPKQKWLQIKNVFVVLHQKTNSDDKDNAIAIWNSIQHALIDWKPSYYRLLISEMQNRLENEPIPFNTNLAHDLEGQAAWLHQILEEKEPHKRQGVINQLFDRLTDELKDRLLDNGPLQMLIDDTFAAFTSSPDKTAQELLDFVVAHVKLKPKSGEVHELKQDIGHALNATLCARDFEGKYITNGTILYDKNNPKEWYLCVAPACETVPLQYTGQLAKRLKPHRLMKVLFLENVSITDALDVAAEGNHIFIKGPDGKRKALSVINVGSKQPVVDYAVIKNHKHSSRETLSDGIEVSFLDSDDTAGFKPKNKTLVPLFQLRDIYAARYQGIASNHSGRVGVDFVDFKKTS